MSAHADLWSVKLCSQAQPSQTLLLTVLVQVSLDHRPTQLMTGPEMVTQIEMFGYVMLLGTSKSVFC